MNSVVLFFATLGPIGKNLPAPGTMGSLVGTIFFMILTLLMGWPVHLIAIGFIPLFLIGIPLCTRAEILLDRNDPGEVIWDEFCVIPFVYLPLANLLQQPVSKETFFWIGVGFILFRFFDVAKPWVIRSVQKFPRGLGVMIDDLLAAGAAALVLWALKTFSLSFFS